MLFCWCKQSTTACLYYLLLLWISAKSASAEHELLSCTANNISSFDARQKMDTLTRTVSQNPYTLSLLAEGGAAGSGGSVVSEGQGYAVLTAGISLASLDINDSKRSEATTTFWGYFNGWKRMCINSTNQSACQTTKYCSHDAYVTIYRSCKFALSSISHVGLFLILCDNICLIYNIFQDPIFLTAGSFLNLFHALLSYFQFYVMHTLVDKLHVYQVGNTMEG